MDGCDAARETVLRILFQKGPMTFHRLTRHLDAPRDHLRSILARLMDQDELLPRQAGKRTVYLPKTAEVRMCTCDGSCLTQIVVLHDPRCRSLRNLAPTRGGITGRRLVQTATAELAWAQRTTYKWLRHLLDADLMKATPPPVGDRRTRVYRRRDPHPTTAAWLAHTERSVQEETGY